VITGPPWRVNHHGRRAATSGVFNIVGGKDEEEAVAKVRAAYRGERIIDSVEKLD
jgi:hypothetical protein